MLNLLIVDFNSLGLNLVVNMKSLVNLGIATTPYNVKISSRTDIIDQKRGLIELRPGYHLVVRVTPKVVDTSDDFENFDIKTRDCKLTFETNEGGFFQNYTKYGCELECALHHSFAICKCMPWYFPNHFKEMSICDMFGSKCFDMVLSDETYYKDCSNQCLEACKSTSYAAIPSYLPIDPEEICPLPHFQKFFWELYQNQQDFIRFDSMTTGKWKNWNSDRPGHIDFCEDYVKKYVAIVTIETPVDTVIKSKRIARITFNDQLAVVGGTLGLFTGISILSMVEVLCFCLTLTKRMCLIGKDKICKKKVTSQDAENEKNEKEEDHPKFVKEFVGEIIQSATNKSSLTHENEMTNNS